MRNICFILIVASFTTQQLFAQISNSTSDKINDVSPYRFSFLGNIGWNGVHDGTWKINPEIGGKFGVVFPTHLYTGVSMSFINFFDNPRKTNTYINLDFGYHFFLSNTFSGRTYLGIGVANIQTFTLIGNFSQWQPFVSPSLMLTASAFSPLMFGLDFQLRVSEATLFPILSFLIGLQF